MSNFFRELRQRLIAGIRITNEERATVQAVVKRMRKAIDEGRGIRLSKDELRVLGLYGLKNQLNEESKSAKDDGVCMP